MAGPEQKVEKGARFRISFKCRSPISISSTRRQAPSSKCILLREQHLPAVPGGHDALGQRKGDIAGITRFCS